MASQLNGRVSPERLDPVNLIRQEGPGGGLTIIINQAVIET